MIRVPFLLTLLVAAVPASANQIDDGREAVELHLIQAGRWPAVQCDTGYIDNDWYSYCHPAGDDSFGGLFMLSVHRGLPVVEPVNGKAKQYMDVDEIDAMNGGTIAVQRWRGDPTSIARIIATLTE